MREELKLRMRCHERAPRFFYSPCHAVDSSRAPFHAECSSYFRMETVPGADEGPDRNRERLLVELYDVTEVPPVADRGTPNGRKAAGIISAHGESVMTCQQALPMPHLLFKGAKLRDEGVVVTCVAGIWLGRVFKREIGRLGDSCPVNVVGRVHGKPVGAVVY